MNEIKNEDGFKKFLIILAGLGLVITALIVSGSKSIRQMEPQKEAEGSLAV